jgi:hypothetical protein
VFGRRTPLLSPPEGLLLLREFSQRFRNVGETGNKPSVISAQAQEASYFVFILGSRPFPYGFKLLRVSGYSHTRDNMPEEPYFLLKELAVP